MDERITDGPLTRALFLLAVTADALAYRLYRLSDRAAVRETTRGQWGAR